MTTILLVPGLGNSGPQHWQTLWEQRHHYSRVQQADWDQPVGPEWVQALADTIARRPGPVVLVAHSLGCATVAKWAQAYPTEAVVGALLVAPADTDRPDFPPEVTGFAPMPLHALPFPSIVVASTNDQYVTLPRANDFATAWGSQLVNVGPQGHLNADSDLGAWLTGQEVLAQLLADVSNR
jgi:predicted alpha/beta hydrolase family esterase